MTAQAGSAPSPLPAQSSIDRNLIRREMRRRRRALSDSQRTLLARRIAIQLARSIFVKPHARIAVYLATRGEADLAPFILLARRRQCRLYLPRILNARCARMEFFPFPAGKPLRRNRFGIAELPSSAVAPTPPHHLDVVLAPVVAFDAQGWRLGMGAGYYDRRLSALRRASSWRRPKLIGVAYDFQQVASLSPQTWDVQLDGVATESGTRRFRRQS